MPVSPICHSKTQAVFNPNKLSFNDGIERIQKALSEASETRADEIVTSRDAGADKLIDLLKVDNIPDGFTKYQLPVFMKDIPGVQFFLSYGAPGIEVGHHSHDEGDGFRFIASGSIVYDGKELTAGDWMFIPKGKQYSFKVGRQGVGLCYCYSCCCA